MTAGGPSSLIPSGIVKLAQVVNKETEMTMETPMTARQLSLALWAATAEMTEEGDLPVKVEVAPGAEIRAVLLVHPADWTAKEVVLTDTMPLALSVSSKTRAAWRVEGGRLKVLRRPVAPAPAEEWEDDVSAGV
jgi:hypothetical protein